MRRGRRGIALLLCAAMLSCLQACAGSAGAAGVDSAEKPVQVHWPKDKLKTGKNGELLLRVYVVEDQQVEERELESYVEGVLAGEMKNDWPLEALKAQAILARTFVLKFVQEKESQYPGADISTDIEEAQAYDTSAINKLIRQAVEETRGLVLSCEGELPYAWFHAHSGGMTEYARAGLGWEKDEPAYTQPSRGTEPEQLSDAKENQQLQAAAEWKADFTFAEWTAACQKQGVQVEPHAGSQLQISQRGESGRAVTLEIDGQSVNAADLRLALGSTKMRSTLLTSLKIENGKVHMAGKGYGHGVGMSQWGAYGMAQEGKSAVQIIKHYFQKVEIAQIGN